MSKTPLQLQIQSLIDPETIRTRVAELGREITAFYHGEPLTLLIVLNGGIIFGADLARSIDLPLWLDSLRVSSYHGFGSTGRVEFSSMPKTDLSGRHVLLVDDIIDTGLSLKRVAEEIARLNPLSVRSCVCFDKVAARLECGTAKADWTGFEVPPKYVIGYGLDADEYYRNRPDIAIVTNS